MARVLYGPSITAFKGSVGGTTFQKNTSGQIARHKPRRSRSNSEAQQESIILFNYLTSRWIDLDLTTQQEWINFAADHTKVNYWGETKTLSGMNWYISCNTYRNLLGLSLLIHPPSYAGVPATPSFTVDPSTGSLKVIFDPAYEEYAYYLFVYTSKALRRPSDANRSCLRLTTMLDGDEFSHIDLTEAWETTHNLIWPLATTAGAYYILVAIAQVRASAGLASVYTTGIGSLRIS